jgi:hypothetical protein
MPGPTGGSEVLHAPGPDLPSITGGVFPWLSDGGWTASWPVGAVLLAGGIAGALATAYLTDPTFLPQLGGARELRETEKKLQEVNRAWSEELARRRQLSVRGVDDREVENAMSLCDQLERQAKYWDSIYRAQRASLSRRGFPLFVLIGGVVACLLTRSVLEAIAVGAAWPASLRGLGMQTEKQDVKEEARVELAELVESARDEVAQARINERQAYHALQRLVESEAGSRRKPKAAKTSTGEKGT